LAAIPAALNPEIMTKLNPVSQYCVSDPNLNAVDLTPTITSSYLSYKSRKNNIYNVLYYTFYVVGYRSLAMYHMRLPDGHK